VDYLVRETFESSMALGREAVLATGATPEEADAVMDDLRRLDAERFDLEVAGDAFAGRALLKGHLRKRDSGDASTATARHYQAAEIPPTFPDQLARMLLS